MLAYSASREVAGRRESSPNALLLVICAHVALLALAMSAKMDIQHRINHHTKLINVLVPLPPPPPSHPNSPKPRPAPRIDRPNAAVPITAIDPPPVADAQPTLDPLPIVGGGTAIVPETPTPTSTTLIHHDPRLLTPLSELKPPYPAAKLASEEEATLRLRLTIDQRGRVTAVDPVGPADREFLESARRYIIAHWRYEPASDGGLAISSSLTVTLRFELDS